MDAMECLKTRRSVRAYADQPVLPEIIEDIIDAGRLAATAINIQPWVFVAATEESVRKKLADITDHGKFITEAPVCIVVFCEDTKYFLEDGSAATQNILNAARAYGLGSCWIAGDKKPYSEEVKEALNVPENYKLISLIAVGYAAVTPNPEKKPLESVLHWNHFGNTKR
ncbi:MAG: nitroreductase family protein [Armatimonadota bacterium]